MEDMLDVENKRMADSLANKVTRLKSVSCRVHVRCRGEGRTGYRLSRLFVQGLAGDASLWSIQRASYVLMTLSCW